MMPSIEIAVSAWALRNETQVTRQAPTLLKPCGIKAMPSWGLNPAWHRIDLY